MVELCNVIPNLGRSTCAVGSLSVASLSFGLLSTLCNQGRQTTDGSCPALNETSRNLIQGGLLGIGVTSLVIVGRQLVK